jgi:uncharacterized protein involved in outer membrane biogenesis
MRPATVLKLAGLAALLLLIVLVQVVKSINVDRYRPALAQAIVAATGRPVTFGGRIVLKLSLSPFLEANDVRFGNGAADSSQPMATLDHIEVDIGLLPLLMGEVRLARLKVTGADLILQRGADGRASWDFGPLTGPGFSLDPVPPTFLRIDQLRVEDGRIHYRDAAGGEEDLVRIERLTVEADSLVTPLAVTAVGNWVHAGGTARHFDLSGVLGSVKEALSDTKPFPVKLKAVLPGLVATASGLLRWDRANGAAGSLVVTAEATEVADMGHLFGFLLPPLGAARVAMTVAGPLTAPSLAGIDFALGRHDGLAFNVRGSWHSPRTGRGVDLVVAADGETLAGFGKPFDLSLPAVGPIKLSSHVTDVDGGWRLGELRMTAGHSDLAGQVEIRLVSGRPVWDIHLVSNIVELGDWVVPHWDPVKLHPAESRLFPDDPLPLRWLAVADGALDVKIGHLLDGSLPLGRLDMVGSLRDGKLRINPQIGGIAGGRAALGLTMDVAGPTPVVELVLDAEHVQIGTLLDALAITTEVHSAPVDLHIGLSGSGDSVRMIMARLSGETLVSIGPGTIGDGVADHPVAALVSVLAPWAKSGELDSHCLASRFALVEGMAHSEGFFWDTSIMTVAGQGSLTLADEGLDLTFVPKPKDPSLLGLVVPVDVGGTFARPVVASNKGPIVKGLAMPASTTAVPGSGKDGNGCLMVVARAKKTAVFRKTASVKTGPVGARP